MSAFKCLGCGKPNGITDAPNMMAARLAKLIRCPDCAAKAEREEQDHQHERQAEHLRLRLLTLPRELRDVRAAKSPAPRSAVDAAWKWAGQGGGLMLVGPVGTGKTYLAAAAVRHMMRDRDVTWQSVPSMLTLAVAAFDDEGRKQAVRAITGRSALVLDDLDKMKPSEWTAAQLYAAIDNRVTSGAPLLVTANKTPAQLASHVGGEFGKAIASRLAGYCHVVECDGSDVRLRVVS
jgi:DNA replication protein DnaC